MPTVTLTPPARDRAPNSTQGNNPLPSLVHTPSGLAMMELQGSISSETSELETALTLGRLVFPAADEGDAAHGGEWDGKRVMLYVGDHQRLTGEVTKLATPIAVLRRKATTSRIDDDEVEIAEIVYCKMLFAHRPEPLGGQQQDQLTKPLV